MNRARRDDPVPRTPDRTPLGAPPPERAEAMTVVVRTAIRVALPILAVAGLYLVAWGYSPGGGFPGGAVIMGIILLVYAGFGHRKISRVVRPGLLEAIEIGGAAAIIVTEVLGLVLRGSFSANWLPLAAPRTILSGGIAQLFSASELIEVGTGLTIAVFALLAMEHDWAPDERADAEEPREPTEAGEPAGTGRSPGTPAIRPAAGAGDDPGELPGRGRAVLHRPVRGADQAQHDQDGDGPVADGGLDLPLHALAGLPVGSTAPVLLNPPPARKHAGARARQRGRPGTAELLPDGVVIGVAVTAVFLSVVVRIAQHYRTLDSDRVREMRGMTGPALASLLPLAVALPITGAVAAPLLARVSARLP